MTRKTAIGMASMALLLPALTWAETGGPAGETVNRQAAVSNPQSAIPAFPPSDRCSTSKPCRNLLGEITRVEESYWIKQPNGTETRVHVTSDTNMKALPKVGDKIAAQVDSTGDATAVRKIEEFPDRQLKAPEKTLQDLR